MVALPAALVLWSERAVRDRYSIARRPALRRGHRDRRPQRDRGRRRHARPRPRSRSHWPLPEFAVPRRRRRRWKGTPTSPRTTARPRSCPARRTRAAPPPAGSTTPGAIRVCDLFDRPSVISFWFTRGGDCVDQQDVVSDVYRALPWAGGLPLAGRARRPRHGPRADPRARLDGCRSATTATAPSPNLYRVGGCPTFVYVYPGGILQSASIGELDRCRSSSARVEELLRAAQPRRRPSGRPRRRGAGSAPRAGLGRAPSSPTSSPGSASPRITVDGGPGHEPGGGPRAGCASSPTASTASTRSTCANGRSPGPTGSSSARSASTPTTPAPRSSSWRWSACTTAPSRAAACSTTRSTIAIVETGVALRAFDGEQVAGGSASATPRPGRSCRGRPGELRAGHPGDRRRARPGRAPLRRHRRLDAASSRVTRRLTIAAIQVNGVPQIAVDEALWLAAGLIDPAPALDRSLTAA